MVSFLCALAFYPIYTVTWSFIGLMEHPDPNNEKRIDMSWSYAVMSMTHVLCISSLILTTLACLKATIWTLKGVSAMKIRLVGLVHNKLNEETQARLDAALQRLGSLTCITCREALADCITTQCGHMVICMDCAGKIQEQQRRQGCDPGDCRSRARHVHCVVCRVAGAFKKVYSG